VQAQAVAAAVEVAARGAPGLAAGLQHQVFGLVAGLRSGRFCLTNSPVVQFLVGWLFSGKSGGFGFLHGVNNTLNLTMVPLLSKTA
jgi:hypothetical protein